MVFPDGCRLLDVGCGTGNILHMLSQFGEARGVDCSPIALEFCRRRGLKNLHLGDVSGPLPFPNESFDMVCVFDILEHVDDDGRLLEEMRRIRKSGGCIAISVPALQLLWSEHDEALHHQRRYTKQEIKRLMQAAGMRVRKLIYTNALLFPLALTYRLAKRFSPFNGKHQRSEFFINLPTWVNSALLTRMNFPIGVSILAVCEKVGHRP